MNTEKKPVKKMSIETHPIKIKKCSVNKCKYNATYGFNGYDVYRCVKHKEAGMRDFSQYII